MRKKILRIAALASLSALILAASTGTVANMGLKWFGKGVADAMRPAIEMATPTQNTNSKNTLYGWRKT